MKQSYYKKILIIISLVLTAFVCSTSITFAYWVESISGASNLSTSVVTIGEWEDNDIPTFDEQEDYNVGDKFTYDDKIWIVIETWFDESRFLNPDGSINTDHVRPYGPLEEETDQWSPYNVYQNGESVFYNGYEWVANDGGASGHEPGTDTKWQRQDPEWFVYNTYHKNDVVTYNGYEWVANYWNRGVVPSDNASEWTKVN